MWNVGGSCLWQDESSVMVCTCWQEPTTQQTPPAEAAGLAGCGQGQQGVYGGGNSSGIVSGCDPWNGLSLVGSALCPTPLAASPTQPRGTARGHPGHPKSSPGLLISTFISDKDFYNHTFMFSLTLFSSLSLILLWLLHFCCPYKFYLNCIWD